MNQEKIKSYLKILIRWLAIWTLRRYQPGVIGVTGSVGKTSTKEAIHSVLKNYRRARKSPGNFNSDLGLPLTILGDWTMEEFNLFGRENPLGANSYKKSFFIAKVILFSLFKIIFRSRKYPELLVLEYAIDKPGDMKYLLDIVRPQVGVVTAIGDIPVHVEFFSGPDAVAREKSKIVEILPATGFAILNGDDESVLGMKDRTRAHTMTYGFGEHNNLVITNFETKEEGGRPSGITMKLNYGGNTLPVRLPDCFGKAQAYAAAAAAAVGIIFGINLVKITEAFSGYQVLAGRGRLLDGVKQTYILDDAYNASPLSMHAAIDTMKGLSASRKVAVLGDMLEIGHYTIEAHESIGELAAKVFDILVTVGSRAKFIAEAATNSGMAQKRVFSFETAEEAAPEVQKLIKKGDLILIKASHGIGLSKIVEEIQKI